MRGLLALSGILLTPWIASAQIPSSTEILDRVRGGGVLMDFVMLDQAAVQQEIRATPEQIQQARSLAETQRAQLRGLSQMSRAEAAERIAATRSSSEAGLNRIFSAGQRARLREIGLQKSGPLIGLTQPDVEQAVALTTEQRQQLRSLQEGLVNKLSAMAPPPQSGLGRARGALNMVREVQASKQQADMQALALLTPEQQRAWSNLQGAKFEGETNFGTVGGRFRR